MTDLVLQSSDVPADFRQQMHMAQVLSESSLLPAHLRGKPANVLVILSGARALNVPAFWALQSMYVVDGKLTMAAELMRALVIRAGHVCRVVERSAKRAVVEIHRKDRSEPYRAEFTWQDVLDARLDKKDNYVKYPKSMMVARATVIAVRDECPDVLFGVVYTPDELGAVTDEEGAPIESIDGEVVPEATPAPPVDLTQDAIDQLALRMVLATSEQLPGVWADVTKVEADGLRTKRGDTLYDVAADRMRRLIADILVTEDDLRALWKFANSSRLIGARVSPEPGKTAIIGDLIIERSKQLREPAPVKVPVGTGPVDAEVVELPEPSEIIEDAVVVDGPFDPVKFEESLSPHAQRLRAEAAASWGETEATSTEESEGGSK